jgi:pimeloyl-ACP methyl ester carboxylesterase
MYVQRAAPEQVTFGLPVVFVHGGAHTGATWETTPDGREGWQLAFVRRGFDTFVIDQPWRGRSAPDVAGLDPASTRSVEPAVTAGFTLAAHFARGGKRFPMSMLQQYASQLWPDFGVLRAHAAGQPGLSDPKALPALVELVDRLGHCILITHSQGAHLGWEVALARPRAVAGIVAIEPAVTDPGLSDPAFRDIPVFIMWGDNLPMDGPLSQQAVDVARGLGGHRLLTLDVLPESGIRGNGHMLMMESNSDELAQRVVDWLRSTFPRPIGSIETAD